GSRPVVTTVYGHQLHFLRPDLPQSLYFNKIFENRRFRSDNLSIIQLIDRLDKQGIIIIGYSVGNSGSTRKVGDCHFSNRGRRRTVLGQGPSFQLLLTGEEDENQSYY